MIMNSSCEDGCFHGYHPRLEHGLHPSFLLAASRLVVKVMLFFTRGRAE